MINQNLEKELEQVGYDYDFITKIQPEGGIYFTERFIETGNGFQGVLHFYSFAEDVNALWLTPLMNIPQTIVTLDLVTGDKAEVTRNINRSINELKDRRVNERHQTDRNDAAAEEAQLERFAAKLSQYGEIIKLVHLRIYVYDYSQEELEKRIGNIKNDLEGKNHKLTLYQFRTKEEWLSLFTHYDEQMKMGGIRSGEILTATSLGGGLPFHHQALKDPRGTYMGVTSTQGAFIFDPFRSTKTRKSFNGFVLGRMGFGKSTFLKQLEEGLVAKDTFIRGFDKARDFYPLIQSQNGLMIDLAGESGDIINPLEIFATATDPSGEIINEHGSFMQHITKVTTIIRFLYPELSDRTITELRKYLREFYVDFGLINSDYNTRKENVNVTNLQAKDYPIFSDFEKFLKNYQLIKPTNQTVRVLDDLKLYISEMVNMYGTMFNGHTTIHNLEEEPILFFDIDSLSQYNKEVFQSQLFNALTIIWSHALRNGRKMKRLLSEQKITRDELQHFMVFIDESHNIINADNLMAVKYITDFQREMRKFRAGVFFATQSPAEVLPESASSHAIDEVKKVFSLCQYKVFFNLDHSMLGNMHNVLGDTITDTEFSNLTRLKEGEALVQTAPNETYTVQFTPSKRQLELYDGGD